MKKGEIYYESVEEAFKDVEHLFNEINDDFNMLDEDFDGDPSEILMQLESIYDNAKKCMDACETLYCNTEDAIDEIKYQISVSEELEEVRLEKLYSGH